MGFGPTFGGWRRIAASIVLAAIAFAAAAIPSTGWSQARGRRQEAAQARPIHEFPFRLVGNKPFVQVRVDDAGPLWFILDSGCAGTSVIEWHTAIGLGLPIEGVRRAHAGAGEGVTIRVASTRGVTIDVHGAKLPVPRPQVGELDRIEPFEGHRIDGLLGEDFLRRFVVEIDYERGRIRLFEPDSFVYGGPGRSIPIDVESHFAVTRATITPPGREPIGCRMVIDTGARVAIIFNRPFVERHRLRESQAKLLTGVIGCGAGGICTGDVGRLAGARWGPFGIREPVAIFSRDTSGFLAGEGFDGIIGAELLRRCKVTFDYAHGGIVLEPLSPEPVPFEYDMSGLFLVARGEDLREFEVLSVIEDSPAEDGGIEAGDRITHIDGRPAGEHTLGEVRDLLRRDGTECRLDLSRGDHRLRVTLPLRRQI